MREIKFNFYDTIKKKYIRWEDSNAGMSMSAFITHEHLKFLQYTGLKDKKGREIYEGDILKDASTILKKVFYQNGMFGCSIKKRKSFYSDELIEIFYPLFEYYGSEEEVEVIGNIYEHKHLLEETA